MELRNRWLAALLYLTVLFGGLICADLIVSWTFKLQPAAVEHLTTMLLDSALAVAVLGMTFARKWVNLKRTVGTTAVLSICFFLLVLWIIVPAKPLAGGVASSRRLTPEEEFDLRTKCGELGRRLQDKEAAQYGNDAAVITYGWRFNYDPLRNRCYALQDAAYLKIHERDIVLFDAQTQETLAATTLDTGQDQKKNGYIIRTDPLSADKIGYDAAKKFIDERMNDSEP